MKRRIGTLALFGLVLVLTLLAASVYQAAGQQPKEGLPSTGVALGEAERLPLERKKVGQALVNLLGDEKLHPRDREKCALALAKIRYTPAIPKLIDLIDWTVSGEKPSRQNLEEAAALFEVSPCMRALVEYGECAVPTLVDAYLKERDEKRERTLTVVLMKSDKAVNKKFAKLYVQGLLLESHEQRAKVKLLDLVAALEKGN